MTQAALHDVIVWIWISDGKSSGWSSDAISTSCGSSPGAATSDSSVSHLGTSFRAL